MKKPKKSQKGERSSYAVGIQLKTGEKKAKVGKKKRVGRVKRNPASQESRISKKKKKKDYEKDK